ncbi:hypothetical protein AB9P05_08995 [Roseivirga sp. BDSF3-8]|uniref:hypothetical protein n=1 Tax=Roseivirga sp. BDSF3-8 TaxID=3241598 RepID=UPI00353214E8
MQRILGYPSKAIVIALTFICLSSGCSSHLKSDTRKQLAYQNAVRAAQNLNVDDIYTELTAINGQNKNLIRDTLGRIKVVTWTNWSGYEKKLLDTLKIARSIWVTVAPQMKEACSSMRRGRNKPMRIRQWLGLPPDAEYTHFVEMYVHPDDIFRPCPDPGITDRECELNFPGGLYAPADSAYMQVYSTLKAGTQGYPFTGLGYTYDWGNPRSKVGFSEFIVKDGAVAFISSVTPTEVYCN